MKTYPLESLSIEEAVQLQHKVVDCITREFGGHEILSRGDLGVVPGIQKPSFTRKAEKAIASVFGAEDCLMVRGAGTGAIRMALYSMIKAGEKVLVHDAPVYTTTKTTLDMMGLTEVKADFNDIGSLKKTIAENPDIKAAIVQYTRQQPEDRYDMGDVIRAIKDSGDIPIVTDDNYAAMKVRSLGCQLGADLTCFSAFKLLGPEGVGCIVGKRGYIEMLSALQYSGGSQVQGFEALEVLRGFTYAPVALAIQAGVIHEAADRLNSGEIEGIQSAYIANAQSKVLLVELKEPIAKRVLEEAEKLGAAPNPVGAESKYEISPMFYRVSGTFLNGDPTLADRMIRINPMRSGTDTVLRILKEAMERVISCF